MGKPLPALVQRILSATEPTITTEELKWLAAEYSRLHAQRREGDADIPPPPASRDELRHQVEVLENEGGPP